MVVYSHVLGYAEKPGADRDALPLEGPDRLKGAYEHVLSQVFGVKAVADAGDDVCVDPIEVVFVDLFEGGFAAGLGAFY